MNTPDILIEKYELEAVAADEGGFPTTALEAQLTANVMTRWRDALMDLTPDPIAVEALERVGYCPHSTTVYFKLPEPHQCEGYRCDNCGRFSEEPLVPYR